MAGEIPKPTVCRVIDTSITTIGRALAWLNVVLVVVILVQVVMRYVFGIGLVYLEELQWHLFAVLIMFGIVYGVPTNSHIRLDVLHRNFSRKTQELIEFLGILILLLPMAYVLFYHGLDFVESSYRVGERSDSPLGLPYRWIIKSVVPVSMGLLGLAGISRMLKALHTLIKS